MEIEFDPANGDAVVEIEPIKPDYLTVGDLIEKLKTYDKDLQVVFFDRDLRSYNIRTIGTVEYESGNGKLTFLALSEMSLDAMKKQANPTI